MACTACFVCFISTVNGHSNKKKRKEEAHPWKASASSGQITNLKQSILVTFDIYGYHASRNHTFPKIFGDFLKKHLVYLAALL